MKNVFFIVSTVLTLQIVSGNVFSQEELSQEIDKLESGEEAAVESVVNENPEASASEVEAEIGKEADSLRQAAPAPDTLPEDLEPQAPQEEISQPAFEQVPPSENIEDSLNPAQEEIAEPVQPPADELQPVPTDVPDQVVDTKNEVVPSDFENRLGRIYQQFYSEATTDEAWYAIVGDKVNETYTIQPGDTLWDISVTFFGNGHYWPKVWQVNDEITNPHSISAGYVLKFVPGQMDKAPSLQMTKEGEQTDVDQNVVKLEDPSSPTIETVAVIPPPSKKYASVLTKLPPSLPFIRSREVVGFDKDGFSIDSKKIEVRPSAIYIPSYISEVTPAKMGKVIDMEGEQRTTAGIYELVYVKLDDSANPGDILLVYDVGSQILSLDKEIYIGTPVYLRGEIQIQELTNSEDNIYRAQVIKAISPIQTGSFTSKEKLLVSDITDAGPSVDISANVIGGQFDSKRRHMGMHEVVYLDKGLSGGLRPGQILSIMRNPESRGKKSVIQDLTHHIAKVKIVKTTDNSATALVLNSKEDIRKGDFLGSLRMKASGKDPESGSGLDSEPASDEFIEGE